jgi:hypothetical protein
MNNKRTLFIPLILSAGFLWTLAPGAAQEAKPAAAAPAFPRVLPGKGLAQHDFFYAGEAKTQDMYIVRKGKVAWEFHDPAGKGEISDAVLLSNGNVLFAHQFGVTLIDRNKKVLWNYDAPAGTEIHTAQPIGKDKVLYVQNGDPAKCVVVNIVTGKTEREFVLPVKNPKSVHGHFRHARLTEAGTLAGGAHGHAAKSSNTTPRVRNSGRNTPGCGHLVGGTFEERQHPDRRGKTGSRGEPRRGPGLGVFARRTCRTTCSTRCKSRNGLPNGNTLINTWFNQWNGPGGSRHGARSGAGNHAGQESRLGVARVGKAGGSRTLRPRFSYWMRRAFPKRCISAI